MADLVDRLDLSEDQEELVLEQAKLFRKRVRSIKGEARKTRTDLATALRADSFDETIVGHMYARHDDALRLLRLELVERLANVHAGLEPAQREQLADLIESGRGGGGPFRTGW